MIIASSILTPKGRTGAIIRNIELGPLVNTPYRKNAQTVLITYELPNYGQFITSRYIARVSPSSEIGKVFAKILGEIPEPADTDLLIDERCSVVIEHRVSKKTGNTFANVIDVDAHAEESDEDLEPDLEDQDGSADNLDNELDQNWAEDALLEELMA